MLRVFRYIADKTSVLSETSQQGRYNFSLIASIVAGDNKTVISIMDLDDFDDLDKTKPTQVPSRVSKFLPKSSLNKPVSKTEPAPEKSEPQQLKKPKTEETTIASLTPKTEPSFSNGDVKMESKPGPQPELEPTKVEPEDSNIDELQSENDEDMIVREIDVFFTPSIEADTKVSCLSSVAFDFRLVSLYFLNVDNYNKMFQLYVMQFPSRPRWRPFELDERCEEVFIFLELQFSFLGMEMDV